MINEQGGINGRRINFITRDDGYSPPKTVELVRKMVEEDQVLALFAWIRAELPPLRGLVHAAGVLDNIRLLGLKLEAELLEWEAYVFSLVERLWSYSKRGFAFNSLTSYSDRERMRRDLYYPDPARLFDFCKRNLSRNVSVLHDYGLYEFTILVDDITDASDAIRVAERLRLSLQNPFDVELLEVKG
jgi:hypothetical protein